MKLYNTLSRSVEEFVPQSDSRDVKMYSCGPTVYDYQHIGHMRRYVGDDVLIRVLIANGYSVHHVMNITDVGHLVSDSDTGEDKMEKGAKKFGKSVWDIAKMFEEQFVQSTQALNIHLPKDLMHATDYIKEQIALIRVLEKKGYTYEIQGDGIYFDTSKFPDYFQLSRQNPEELKKGARVEFLEGKRNAADFALWKYEVGYLSNGFPRRSMNWWFNGGNAGEPLIKRPASEQDLKEGLEKWFASSAEERLGVGFPGWHIECSAMSMKALGSTLDIHTGGIDHIAIHHTNEIAQSECATGKQFVRYWVHHNFLTVEGQKMSKSLGNFYTVQDVVEKGYDPMSLRYLYLQTHYRQEMNFTWEALDAAQTAYKKALREVWELKKAAGDAQEIGCAEFEQRFLDAVSDDMNTAQGLAIFWELLKSAYPASAKLASIKKMDAVLGLELLDRKQDNETVVVPLEVQDLVAEREAFRKAGDWAAADEVRAKIADVGFVVEDSKAGPKIHKK